MADFDILSSYNFSIVPPDPNGVLIIGQAINGPVNQPVFIHNKEFAKKVLGINNKKVTLIKGDNVPPDKTKFLFPLGDYILDDIKVYKNDVEIETTDYSLDSDGIIVNNEFFTANDIFKADLFNITGNLYQSIDKAMEHGATAVSVVRINGSYASVNIGDNINIKSLFAGSIYNSVVITVTSSYIEIVYPENVSLTSNKYFFRDYVLLKDLVDSINADAQLIQCMVVASTTKPYLKVKEYFATKTGTYNLTGGTDNLNMSNKEKYDAISNLFLSLESTYENYRVICLVDTYLDSIVDSNKNLLDNYVVGGYNSTQTYNGEKYYRLFSSPMELRFVLSNNQYQRYKYVNSLNKFIIKWHWAMASADAKVTVYLNSRTYPDWGGTNVETIAQYEFTIPIPSNNNGLTDDVRTIDVLNEIYNTTSYKFDNIDKDYQISEIFIRVATAQNTNDVIDVRLETNIDDNYIEPIIFDYNNPLFSSVYTANVDFKIYLGRLLLSEIESPDTYEIGDNYLKLYSSEQDIYWGSFLPKYKIIDSLSNFKISYNPKLLDPDNGKIYITVSPLGLNQHDIDYGNYKITYYLGAGSLVNVGDNHVDMGAVKYEQENIITVDLYSLLENVLIGNEIETWEAAILEVHTYKAECTFYDLEPNYTMRKSNISFIKLLSFFTRDMNSLGGNLLGIMGSINRKNSLFEEPSWHYNDEYVRKLVTSPFIKESYLGKDDNSISRFVVIPALTAASYNGNYTDGVAELAGLISTDKNFLANQILNVSKEYPANDLEYLDFTAEQRELLSSKGFTATIVNEMDNLVLYRANTFYLGSGIYNKLSAVKILLSIAAEIRNNSSNLVGSSYGTEIIKNKIEGIVSSILEDRLSSGVIIRYDFNVNMNYSSREAMVDVNVTVVGEVESISLGVNLNVK